MRSFLRFSILSNASSSPAASLSLFRCAMRLLFRSAIIFRSAALFSLLAARSTRSCLNAGRSLRNTDSVVFARFLVVILTFAKLNFTFQWPYSPFFAFHTLTVTFLVFL